MDCVYCESSSREEMAQKPQSVHPGVAKNRGNIETAGKKEGRGRLRLTASLLAVTVNADGARFFHELGADRIVLPRFLKISEMKKIAAQEPGLEYEAMIFGDQCPMIDGFCRSFHGQPHEKADPGDIESNRSDRSALGSNEPEKTTDIEYSGDEAASFSTFDTSCEAHHLCGGLCRQADPCAACRLRELAAAGILVMKFGGRGTPLEYRLRTLHFFNRTRQILQQNDPQEDVHEAYNNEITDIFKQMYRETFGHDCSCYYQ